MCYQCAGAWNGFPLSCLFDSAVGPTAAKRRWWSYHMYQEPCKTLLDHVTSSTSRSLAFTWLLFWWLLVTDWRRQILRSWHGVTCPPGQLTISISALPVSFHQRSETGQQISKYLSTFFLSFHQKKKGINLSFSMFWSWSGSAVIQSILSSFSVEREREYVIEQFGDPNALTCPFSK